jgi:hypothetical protein
MHKSGTTLVSQILHHSGINMGDEIDENQSYDQGNQYERRSTQHLNMEILGAKDSGVLFLARPKTLIMTSAQRDRMGEIIRTCNARYVNWGFKDPRTCLTYPLWAGELPVHKLIAVYRAPEEIWPRFRYNGLKYWIANPWFAWAFMQRWYEHTINILDFCEKTSMDYLVLSYKELMTGSDEFERLQSFVAQPLLDRRRRDLYRGQSRSYPALTIATWLMARKTGYTPDQLLVRLEQLGK